MVRRILLVVLVSTMAPMELPAQAAPFGADEHAAEIDRLLKTGRDLKEGGLWLVVIGSIDSLAGTVLGPIAFAFSRFGPADAPTGGASHSTEINPLMGGAIGVGISTVVMVGVGIALLVEGDARVGRAQNLVGAASIRVATTSNGIVVTW